MAEAQARRERGDHLLVEDRIIAKLVDAAQLRRGERVLDLGAGTGALTFPLSDAVGPAGHVTAIEVDSLRAATLRHARANVEVVEGDLLSVALPPADAVVSNPPYKILPPLIKRLLALRVPRSILVVPRELAQRLSAPVGGESYGRLSVEVGVHAKCETLFTVPRSAFEPVPDVPSSAIRITLRPPVVGDLRLLDRVLTAAFASKQNMRHALAGLTAPLGLVPQDISEALSLVAAGPRKATDVAPWEFAAVAVHLARLSKKAS